MILELKEPPISSKDYSTAEYQEARSERLRIDDFTCQMCGSKRNIQVHHNNRARNATPNPYTDLITLCDNCHKRIEDTIHEQVYREGIFDFTVIACSIEEYKGSEKMQACDRVKMSLLVYDNGSRFARYVNDTLPLSTQFLWKWDEFLSSIGCEGIKEIDSERVEDLILDRTGKALFKTAEGSMGAFNRVDHYITR